MKLLRLPLTFVIALLAITIPPNVFAQDSAVGTLSQEFRFAIPDTDESLLGDGPMRRAPWFRKTWNDRRETFAADAADHQHAIVFFGDSITQGWGDLLEASFPGLNVANRGISGDTTRGMLNRLQEDVLDLEPRAVVMLMGTNDLQEAASAETIAGNVKLIVAAIRKYENDVPIVLCLVMPSSATKERPKAIIKSLNDQYELLAKTDPNITLLDTWSLFAGNDGDAKIEEFPDLLHPNEVGYAKWAASLQPVFATLEFTETDDADFAIEPGFTSLFNGHDLTGWGYRATNPSTIEMVKKWKQRDRGAPSLPIVPEAIEFNGQTSTPEGRFVAKHGRLIVTAPQEGRRIQKLSTVAEFGSDFELRLEFRALPMADSGVFIREPQLQCRDFVTAGPYKNLRMYRPQDWNDLVVKVRGNVAHCTCNGEVLEAALKVPDSGSIGLEGDRGQIEYRRLRIKME